jgi:hypothetical protein|tara:strand:- start:378 stop:500 length:123 start_codon:yes stop_codon:yes gene_type:complete
VPRALQALALVVPLVPVLLVQVPVQGGLRVVLVVACLFTS